MLSVLFATQLFTFAGNVVHLKLKKAKFDPDCVCTADYNAVISCLCCYTVEF